MAVLSSGFDVGGRRAATRQDVRECRYSLPLGKPQLERHIENLERRLAMALTTEHAKARIRPEIEAAKARLEALYPSREPTEAEARKRVSELHPDHGGPGGEAFQTALSNLKKAKR